ncbi:hypothetical protein FRC04_012005 [Tulasnella sp. 424]|nr:hypothetical protein FRC04_012005 [Tulasnella sp. 424]KAG8971247.1 hypothetical protein FRC05_011346 [Tulasnella sp. 425]
MSNQAMDRQLTSVDGNSSGAQTPTTQITETTFRGDQPGLSEQVLPETTVPAIGSLQFWLIFIALMVTSFLSAIDLTSVSTALPTIVEDLDGTDFAWVGSAYALGSTAILPLIGGLAQIFGRRPIVIGSILFFALGSGLCGGANGMSMLIAGRTIQGIGGGGILAMGEIVVSDLVPLRQRGAYMGAIGAGNLFVIAGTTLSVVALTWAGAKHPWSSYQVLVPLILGLALMAGFFVYEAKVPVEPVVPWELVNNRTSFLGYATTFLHGIVATCIIYYLPVYFQGSLMQGPVKSGISIFGSAFTITPGGIACGASVAIFNIYRPQNIAGWVLTTVGLGLFSLLKSTTPTAQWVGFQIVEGLGLGILYAAPTFPVLAPIPISENAHALAFFTFVRSYSQTWGVTLGATILQNQLKTKLPKAFLEMFPAEGVEITYAAIPQIPGLPEPMRSEVRVAFASSLRVIWLTMLGLCGLGLICVLGMKELKMHEVTDEDWGMEERKRVAVDEEKDGETR